MIETAPRLLWPADARLGEGPLWDPDARRIFWLDIEGRRLFRCDAEGDDRRTWTMPARIGFAVLTDRPGTLLLGLQDGLHLFRPDGGVAPELLIRPEGFGDATRPNDATVDAAGRLWFGTMHLAEQEGAGALHCVDPVRGHRCVARGWTIPNGPAATPDARALLWADSHRRRVFRLALDDDGGLASEQVFLELGAEEAGVPDGMAFDTEGCLWVAVNGGGRVLRIAPDGSRRGALTLPAPSVSSCRFGGEDLGTLFVTTMTGGGLYAAAPGLRGVPAHRFPLSRWHAGS